MRRLVALNRSEVRWIVWCLVLLAVLSADVVTGGPLNSFDHLVRDQIQRRGPIAPQWMGPPGDLGETGVAAALMLAAALVTAQVTWRVWPLVVALGNFAGVELAVVVLKTVVARPGPGAQAETDGYPGYFPSGHTATSAVCAGTIVFLLCTWGSLRRLDTASLVGQLGGLAVGVVSAVRAMLGDFHWLTDGVGGLLLASVTLTVGFAATRQHVGRTLRPSGIEPP